MYNVLWNTYYYKKSLDLFSEVVFFWFYHCFSNYISWKYEVIETGLKISVIYLENIVFNSRIEDTPWSQKKGYNMRGSVRLKSRDRPGPKNLHFVLGKLHFNEQIIKIFVLVSTLDLYRQWTGAKKK